MVCVVCSPSLYVEFANCAVVPDISEIIAGTKDMHPNGWRLSVGLAIVPAIILFLGSLIVPDTPNSLVYRGKVEKARRTLERVRGTPNVDAEFADIVEAVENGKNVNKFAIFQKKYRPVLVSQAILRLFDYLRLLGIAETCLLHLLIFFAALT